jgi:hypothetical protein
MIALVKFIKASFEAVKRIPARVISALDPYADRPAHPTYYVADIDRESGVAELRAGQQGCHTTFRWW